MTTPTIVYDDECGFCTWCVAYAIRRGTFDVVGFSALDPAVIARLPDGYVACVHLLDDDTIYSCGRATEEILYRMEAPVRYIVQAFRYLPYRARIREPLYRFVANNRDKIGIVLSRKSPFRH